MRSGIMRELKSSFLLFLWLLLVQTVCALFTLLVAALGLVVMFFEGTLVLSGPTPLWVWIAFGAPVGLFWLAMGRVTPHAARPGPAGAAVVLTLWAVLTSLMRNAYLTLLAQRVCGGALEQLLQFLGSSAGFDNEQALILGCFLLTAVFGAGLFLGRKRAVSASRNGQSG